MKRIIYIGVLLGGLMVSNAQKIQVKKADKKYDNYEYIDAIGTYEKVVNKGYKTTDMLEKLGNAYYFNAQYEDAAKWYGELFALQQRANDPEYYHRYSLSLKSIGDYGKANEYLEKYYQAKGEARPELKTYLDIIEENSGRYEIENAGGLNSELSDYGTTLYNGELIFASTRKPKKMTSRTQTWNDQPFSTLYSSKIDADGNLKEAEVFSDKLDSKFNEATPAFTNDGKTVYFTRNNYLKKRGYNDDRTTLLKIYKAELIDGKWTNITELPFNSDSYSVAHPALSPDNKTLYFASDMPGGLGDADIWKVEVNKDGTFGTPVNLGPAVNTEKRESFPFISSDNELYYASNGKLGLGGLDIFMSRITDDGAYEEAINVGKPVNGPMDDFAFYINSESRTGFFTSNRENGAGDDDIYKFTEYRALICEHLIAGLITDTDTGEPLPGVLISLYDDEQHLIATTASNPDGTYSFEKSDINCDKSYRVRAELEEYSVEEKFIRTPKESGESQVDLALKRVKELPAVGKSLNEVLDIPIIYFDLDKWNIRPDAEIEIAKVLQVMEDYPQMKIEIGSHTDCRASYAYNERLSDRRAKSTRDWLIKNGISPDRLIAKGYGESQLVNDCACEPTNESNCTEEEHQKNRRSIFMITSMGDHK